MSIRQVTSSDTEVVVDLWRLVFPEYGDPLRPHRDVRASVARKLDFGDGLFWLAEAHGCVVGTIMAGYDGHRGWIYSLGVHPEARRTGIGRALVEHAEQALEALGCPKVNLQVFSSNLAAQEFWHGVGYRRDEVASFGKKLG
jgi:ribosomal protein S18 acetylase RimI-like enzyme